MEKEVKNGWCNPDLSSFGDLCKAPQERPLQAAFLFLCNLAKEEDTCTQYQIYHLFWGFGGFFWKSFIQKISLRRISITQTHRCIQYWCIASVPKWTSTISVCVWKHEKWGQSSPSVLRDTILNNDKKTVFARTDEIHVNNGCWSQRRPAGFAEALSE